MFDAAVRLWHSSDGPEVFQGEDFRYLYFRELYHFMMLSFCSRTMPGARFTLQYNSRAVRRQKADCYLIAPQACNAHSWIWRRNTRHILSRRLITQLQQTQRIDPHEGIPATSWAMACIPCTNESKWVTDKVWRVRGRSFRLF